MIVKLVHGLRDLRETTASSGFLRQAVDWPGNRSRLAVSYR